MHWRLGLAFSHLSARILRLARRGGLVGLLPFLGSLRNPALANSPILLRRSGGRPGSVGICGISLPGPGVMFHHDLASLFARSGRITVDSAAGSRIRSSDGVFAASPHGLRDEICTPRAKVCPRTHPTRHSSLRCWFDSGRATLAPGVIRRRGPFHRGRVIPSRSTNRIDQALPKRSAEGSPSPEDCSGRSLVALLNGRRNVPFHALCGFSTG